MVLSARAKVVATVIFFMVVLSGCAWAATELIAPFSDVRWKDGNVWSLGNTVTAGTYRPEDIKTFWYNNYTVFEGSEVLAKSILEAGKNPGLGVRSLHARGITGKNVRVAIIDQPTIGEHSEYKEKIIDYYNTTAEGVYEMHGPAVASLLVGEECGTAPGAKLYYAALASWHLDAGYYADALHWIISKNAELPADDKIRVVSVSAIPSGPGTPYTKNTEQWDAAVAEAQAAGILVLDCQQSAETGITEVGYYDLNNPDDLSGFTTGSPKYDYPSNKNVIHAPAGCRTQAQEQESDRNYWQYTGDGGISWTIPYVAGVLAMGWQVNPSLSNDEIVEVLWKTAYVTTDGGHVINPVAFIKEIENPTPDDPTPTEPDPVEPTEPTNPSEDSSSGGGGCNSAGFIPFVLVIASLLLLKKEA